MCYIKCTLVYYGNYNHFPINSVYQDDFSLILLFEENNNIFFSFKIPP